jgi:hypothetical protein
MDEVFDCIIQKDLKRFKTALSAMPDTNVVWESCPLMLIFDTFIKVSDKILARYFIQELIKWGFDKTDACLCLDECEFDPNTVKSMLRECIKTYSKPKGNTRNINPSQPAQIGVIAAVASDYSAHELKRLQTIATELNIRYSTNTHLALKIINHLLNKN